MEDIGNIESIIQYEEPIPTKDIMKVCILNHSNTIKKMVVFQGSMKPISKDNDIFSEYEQLQNNTTEFIIQSSSMQLHPDDSVHIIKKKILHELDMPLLSYSELYLFSKKTISIHLHQLYLEITKNETIPLTKPIIGQLLVNLEIVDKDTLSYFANMEQPTYTLVEFMKGFSKHTYNIDISIPIGRRFVKSRELLYSTNPFNVLHNQELVFHTTNNNALLSFENHLLLSYGNLINNTLYVCTADDVFKYSDTHSISSDYFIKLYYPMLSKLEILTTDELIKQKPNLIKDTKKLMKPKLFKKYKNIDTFYNLYNKQPEKLPYSKNGINKFHMVLHPITNIILPLEYIFKQVHATNDIPYIKYNSGLRREPIYRLYTNARTKTGKKIPLLSRTQIISFSKNLNKPKQLSFVTQYTYENTTEFIFIHINNNGDVVIKGECKHHISAYKLNILLNNKINIIISQINRIIETSGYTISTFNSIYDEQVEIVNVSYICSVPYTTPIKTTELTTLMSNMFHVYQPNINKGAILRFTRVENYKEMTAINSMITQIYKNTNDWGTVKKYIMDNFSFTNEEAQQHITDYLNSHILLNGNYINKTVDIAENPGFPCLIHISNAYATPELTLDVSEITSIHYIDVIHRYFDTFLRVTQYPDKSSISKDTLLKKMAETSKIEDVIIQEPIVAVSSKGIQPYSLQSSNIPTQIDADTDVDDDGIFFDDDDDDDDDDDNNSPKPAVKESINDNELLFQDDSDSDDDNLFFGGNRNFFDKMKKLEPTLFRTKKDGRYDSYARVCPSQSNRQPVILTKEELEAMDENSYEVAMPYGSNPENKYWYVCPRYWCLQTNKPMTDKQVADGECGGKIIPSSKSNNPPPGHYIYEFTDERQHKDKDNNYRQHRPGFLGAKSHPDSCLPCCFKEMNTTQQNIRRKECGVMDSELRGNPEVVGKLINKQGKVEQTNPSNDDVINTSNNTVDKPVKEQRKGMNVLGHDKFPIDASRWGFLPLSVELFLRTDNSTSVTKNNPALIRQTETPLLRYGVEYSHNQSFIACIADIYTYHNNINTPTIPEMRKIIASHITLDVYIKLNNGSIVSIFQPKKTSISDITVEKYRTTKFYQSFNNLENISQNRFLKDTIASYQNFLNYLKNDDSFIDHTYMWDIISSPDTGIFKDGINIALIEIINHDITNNVSLLCPTNSYTSRMFDIKKGTCILLKQDNIYEPIYLYGNTKISKHTKKNAVKIFYQQNTPSNLLNLFSIINKTTNKYCKPRPSMPDVYDYKTNISAAEIYTILQENRLIVENQVRNYRGKTIAFIVKSRITDNNGFYIPTAPSSNIDNVNMIFTDEVEWQTYETTRDRLLQISDKSQGKILCKPQFKVTEDGLIVGIFTETNQFIQISEPVQDTIEDGIPKYQVHGYKDNEYYQADKSLSTDTSNDSIRTQTIRNISLETQFYKLFRNKLRVLLSNYKYKTIRDEIVGIIENKQYLYNIKMKMLISIIQHTMNPHISFVDFDKDVLDKINDMNGLINKDDIIGLCSGKSNQLCIPKQNLISDNENELLYYTRLTDELVRYNRIRLFILDPTKYLNIGDIEYDINADEILSLYSTIISENFDELIPMPTNKYIQNISYDFANPTTSNLPTSENEITLEQQYNNSTNASSNVLQKECVSTVGDVIVDKSNWHLILHDGAKEHVMNTSVQCSFYIILHIMKTYLQIDENIHDIKKRLCSYYKPIIENYLLKLCDIFNNQGKSHVNMLKKKQINIDVMIMGDDYMLTAIDYWVISINMKLPIILFHSNSSLPFNNNLQWLRLAGDPENDEFFFIRMISNNQYNLITPPSMISDLIGFQQLIESPSYTEHFKSFDDFIGDYEIAVPKLKIKAPRKKKA
jgi:hypothetical protein